MWRVFSDHITFIKTVPVINSTQSCSVRDINILTEPLCLFISYSMKVVISLTNVSVFLVGLNFNPYLWKACLKTVLTVSVVPLTRTERKCGL